nr:hybrid nucleoside-diphosphate sugar epimerase/sugar transferase [Rubripirellula obstinata]
MLFITGATGFLGSEILRQAMLDGQRVHAVGRSLIQGEQNETLKFSQIDLASDELSADLLDGCDQVLHVAGLAHQFGKLGNDRERFQQVNVGAVNRVAEAAGQAGTKHFILISSVGVYGEGEGVRSEKANCHPEGFYAVSKFDGEKAAQEVCGRYGMTLTILRMATLYGEHDRGNVQRLIEGIDRGVIPFFGAGKNRKSLVHVQDAAAACLKVAQDFRAKQTTGTVVFNVAGEPRLMRDVYRDIRIGLGKSEAFIRIPMVCVRLPFQTLSNLPVIRSVARKIVSTLDKWSRDDAYDGSGFQQRFGFTPSVDLATGVGRQARWYRIHRQDLFRRRLAKRVFDFGLAAALLVAFSIPMMIVALLVKLTSPGPVVYYSDRVGKNNQLFPMPKFRTMRIDTPQVATHLLGDSAKWLTPIGNLLRKTSLDELPQLLSVLKGDMSFVGPRPALFNQDDLIAMRDRAGVSRLKPGITGWAQINGRDDLSLPEKVVYDQQYLLRRSIIEDIKIIFATGLQAFVGKGVRSADEADGISAWQTLQQSADRTKTIITDPESALLVSDAVATLGWEVSIHSLRKSESLPDLIQDLAAEQYGRVLLIMPKKLLEKLDKFCCPQQIANRLPCLNRVEIEDSRRGCFSDQQIDGSMRMHLSCRLRDFE